MFDVEDLGDIYLFEVTMHDEKWTEYHKLLAKFNLTDVQSKKKKKKHHLQILVFIRGFY